MKIEGGAFGSRFRLLRREGNSFTEYRLDGEASRNRVKSILETADGTVWVGTISGLQKLVEGASGFQQCPRYVALCDSYAKPRTGPCGLG